MKSKKGIVWDCAGLDEDITTRRDLPKSSKRGWTNRILIGLFIVFVMLTTSIWISSFEYDIEEICLKSLRGPC